MIPSPELSISATRLRTATPNARLAIGVLASGPTGRLAATLVSAAGAGTSAPIEPIAYAIATAPDDVARLLFHLVNDVEPPLPAKLLAAAARRLAEVEAELLQGLLSAAQVSADRVLVVVVQDPGVWNFTEDKATGYASLCDAASLAELTNLNVIDALPARDIAAGGQGGPVTALGEARLLRSRQRCTLLVDFGRTVRATYIPALGLVRASGDGYVPVLSFQVGPGMRLLDALVHKLTGGNQAMDAGGRLAVQGQQVPELLAHWQKDSYFDRPLPRWHPAGVRPERFLMDSYQLAIQSNWSVRDMLCTATHFIAQMVADTIERRLPSGGRVDEVVLTGGGIHNGLLMRQVAARLTVAPIVRVADRCCPAEAFEPAAIAAVGLLTIDQAPATIPQITGAREPCVAGRLTPGSSAAWRRLLAEMGSAAPSGISLRHAS